MTGGLEMLAVVVTPFAAWAMLGLRHRPTMYTHPRTEIHHVRLVRRPFDWSEHDC